MTGGVFLISDWKIIFVKVNLVGVGAHPMNYNNSEMFLAILPEALISYNMQYLHTSTPIKYSKMQGKELLRHRFHNTRVLTSFI